MRGLPSVMFGIFLAVATGCTIASYVRSEAARDFQCPEEQVQATPVGSLFRATGCGRDAVYTRGLLSPIARATSELQCPAAQIHMATLGGDRVGVEGCGRRASYAYIDGDWVESPAR